MPTINVSRVIKNPKFAQPFTVHRKSGDWDDNGKFVESEKDIKMYGTVTVPSAQEIIQIPEGDRVTGVMSFHATQEIYTTRDNGTSDEITWRGNRYRIYQVNAMGGLWILESFRDKDVMI